MSKSTVSRLFIGSLIAAAVGATLAVIAVWLANANDVFVMRGSEIIGIQGSALAWSLLGLGVVGGLAIAGAMIGGLVAWIGALLNTAQLEGKTWFIVLLVLGIFNLGILAMIAYVIAGPNGGSEAASQRGLAPSTA